MIIMHQLASQLNRQIILLLECPLTHYWSSTLILVLGKPFCIHELEQREMNKKKIITNKSTLSHLELKRLLRISLEHGALVEVVFEAGSNL